MNNKKVLVAMSGGLDSSCAALKLMDEGYTLYGVTLKLYTPEGQDAEQDISDAASVAENLGFTHEAIDMGQHFCDTVIADFVESYRKGETPNPCIVCNKCVKFGKLLDIAVERGFDYIATGHYAKVAYDEASGRYLLKKADDLSKDQTYVLYHLTQHQLSHLLLPLGDETKEELRVRAAEKGLVNAHKKDSQDICFVPDGDYASFLEKYTGKALQKGNMVNKNGDVLATHQGIEKYTIGQRKGLGVGFGKVQFVISKNAERNEIVIGDAEDLMRESLIAENVNFISIEKLEAPLRVYAKTRYSQKEQPATLHPIENGVKVVFDEPQRAITPGQAVVFYDGDIVVGGGIISNKK